MAHDFAKQRGSDDDRKRKRAVTRGHATDSSHWSWYFSGLMTGVILAIASYLGVIKLGENLEAAGAQSAPDGAPAEASPIYTFYRELANAEVSVSTPAAPPTSDNATSDNDRGSAEPSAVQSPPVSATVTSADVQSDRLYLLQVGSFLNREDAEDRRAQIILLNLNANISQGVVNGRTRYRVQAGPFAGRESADTARELLTANGFESMPSLVQ